MKKVIWNDSLNTGIKTIDDQHRKLFDFFNEFSKNLEINSTKQVLEDILQKMTDYVDYHFSTEEELFAQCKFPEAEKHIQQHDMFRKKVSEYIKKKSTKELQLSFEIIVFLSNWIIDHIKVSDREYIPYFKDMGIE